MTEVKPYSLVYGMDPIFRKKAEKVEKVDDEIRLIADRMAQTMYFEQGVGIGANMVGVLKAICVVDIRPNGEKNLLTLINPEIIEYSKETQVFEEASLCFPSISADIERPKAIKLSYLDYDGKQQEMEAEGFLATVIQHEMDYLKGKIYLDYLSKMKSDNLKKKLEKHLKNHSPHIHTAYCQH